MPAPTETDGTLKAASQSTLPSCEAEYSIPPSTGPKPCTGGWPPVITLITSTTLPPCYAAPDAERSGGVEAPWNQAAAENRKRRLRSRGAKWPICRGDAKRRSKQQQTGRASHARGRWFETSRAHRGPPAAAPRPPKGLSKNAFPAIRQLSETAKDQIEAMRASEGIGTCARAPVAAPRRAFAASHGA